MISWNNMCCQASLIVTPLVLSTIYTYNWEAAFYFSGGIIAVAALVMLYMSCRDDRQQLGKKGMVPEAPEKVDIEMQTKEKKVESSDNATSPAVVVPSSDVPAEVSSEVVQIMESAPSVHSTEPVLNVQSTEPVLNVQLTESNPAQPSKLTSIPTPVVSSL